MKRLINFLVDFFDFSPSERRGFIILWGVILCLIGITFWLKTQTEHYDVSNDKKLLDSLIEVLDQENQSPKITPIKSYDTLNLQEKVHIKELSDRPKKSEKTRLVAFDVNDADTSDFQQISGIGKVFSQRIIKYRQLLGGFYSLQQLNEVYGLEDFSFPNTLFLDSTKIKKININKIPFLDLVAHPYFNKKQAGQTIGYRDKYKPFESKKELLKVYSIDTIDFVRIRPYLEEINNK